MIGLLLASVALADPPVVERQETKPVADSAAATPTPVQPADSSAEPSAPQAPGAPPESDELSAAQRAALADYELLMELDLLADLEVARYLDLLRLEED